MATERVMAWAAERLGPAALAGSAAIVEGLVGLLLLQGELLATWFLRRHKDLHLRERERQEAEILHQPTPCR